MNLLKKHSENRLENLKRELINVENEEDDIRCSVSLIGGNSIKEQQKDLLRIQYEARHRKERAEGAEQLQQRVIAGLVHLGEFIFIFTCTSINAVEQALTPSHLICILGEMLGIQPREDETSVVNDLLRDIEAVLDTLLDEREKQVQQQGQPHSQSTMESFSRSVNGTNLLQNVRIVTLMTNDNLSKLCLESIRILRHIIEPQNWILSLLNLNPQQFVYQVN